MSSDTQSLVNNLSKCLCPAGNGVHTVETAKARKQALQSLLYQTQDRQIIQDSWLADLGQGLQETKPMILGICSDTGGGILRGANWGPLCVRQQLYQNNFQQTVNDLGDIRVIPHLLHDKYLNLETIQGCREALYGDANNQLPVSPLSISEFVLDSIYQMYPTARIFSIGGDHSISCATAGAYIRAKRAQGIRHAIIHFDAHTDLSATRLGIDLNFSTWAYTCLELLKTPQDMIQIGIRSSGQDKAYWTKHCQVQQYWSHEVLSQGAEVIGKAIADYLQAEKIEEVFVSFDIDAIDSDLVSATGTPEKDGLQLEDALTIIETINQVTQITGADLAEVAPFTQAYPSQHEPESTLAIAGQISRALIEGMQ